MPATPVHWPNLIYAAAIVAAAVHLVLEGRIEWAGWLLGGTWALAVACDIERIGE